MTLSSDAAATVYVGDEITFSTTGGNGAAVSIEGANSETITANVWTATVGEHTFTASQPKNGDYCAQESELVLTVLEKTPVTAVTVAGAETAYEGGSVTYTATAENATEYRWKVNGAIQAGAEDATFTYNATATGTFAIVCEARNNFNAAGAWIASDAKNLVVSYLYGELIKATLNGGNSANMSGVIGGTFDSNLGSGKYKIDKNTYAGVQLASYSFKEGDTVVITMTTKGSNYPCLFADKNRTNCLYLATETSEDLVYKIVLPAAANGLTSLYLSRGDDNDGYKWNPVLSDISVVRPMPIVSEAWESLTIDNGPTSYNRTGTVVNVVDAYLDPKVVVTKHVVYADATEANVDVEVTDLEVEGNQYVGHVTIGGDVYTINIAKLASYDVTYMDGELVLGTEVVAANGHPAEFADYQNPQLATFGGWYRDADLTNQVANIASEIISANATYYAKYTKYYATSINIEQLVLDNSMNYGIIAQLGSLHYASNITGSLDSLDVKENGNRNYPYLGLKVKQSGALLNFRVAAGNTVKVKFGNVAKTPNVSINGGDYAEMTITNNVYTYEATADALISIKMMDGNAVVFKQIQIGATPELEVVSLPLILGANGYSTYAANHKFTVSGATVYKAAYNGSDAVILTEVVDAVVPANEGIILVGEEGAKIFTTESTAEASDFSGNKLVSVVAQVTDIPANSYVLSTNAGVTEFNPCDAELSKIPANKAYIIINGQNPAPSVRIVFAENGATGINELEGAEKAVKFIENGKLYIQKDGVVYDATGAKVK